MTDPHDLDELASAQLDGTTSPEEAAQLAADPALRARVAARADELRTVQRAIAEVPPPHPARRDAAIAAALAAFDEARTGATVTPLSPRRGLSPRAVRALGAAAIVLLVALLVPLLTRTDRDDETASLESTGDAAEGEGGGTSDGANAQRDAVSPEEREAGGFTSTTAQRFGHLGAYDDLDALAAAVASAAPRSADAAYTPDGDDGPYCEPPTTASWMVSRAEVAGEPVEVYVHTAADGTRQLIVRATGTCELLDQRDL